MQSEHDIRFLKEYNETCDKIGIAYRQFVLSLGLDKNTIALSGKSVDYLSGKLDFLYSNKFDLADISFSATPECYTALLNAALVTKTINAKLGDIKTGEAATIIVSSTIGDCKVTQDNNFHSRKGVIKTIPVVYENGNLTCTAQSTVCKMEKEMPLKGLQEPKPLPARSIEENIRHSIKTRCIGAYNDVMADFNLGNTQLTACGVTGLIIADKLNTAKVLEHIQAGTNFFFSVTEFMMTLIQQKIKSLGYEVISASPRQQLVYQKNQAVITIDKLAMFTALIVINGVQVEYSFSSGEDALKSKVIPDDLPSFSDQFKTASPVFQTQQNDIMLNLSFVLEGIERIIASTGVNEDTKTKFTKIAKRITDVIQLNRKIAETNASLLAEVNQEITQLKQTLIK